MDEFGFMGVAIVDADNEVVAGVARVLAAKQAGFDEVPAIRVQHLTKAQLKAYRIADNKIAEDATWDLGEMKLEFDAILELDPEFELEITGFHSAEIDLVMEGGALRHPIRPTSLTFAQFDRGFASRRYLGCSAPIDFCAAMQNLLRATRHCSMTRAWTRLSPIFPYNVRIAQQRQRSWQG